MKQYFNYLSKLLKFSFAPTVVLAILLVWRSSVNLAFTLIYFTAVFAASHALHLTIAFKKSRPGKMTSNAMKAVGFKFLMILAASVIFLVTMEMERAGMLIVVLLYIYYMIASAQFYYKN